MTERWTIKDGEIVDTETNMTFDSFIEILTVLNGQSRHLDIFHEEKQTLITEFAKTIRTYEDEIRRLKLRLTDKDDLLSKQLTINENLNKQIFQREKEISDIKKTLNDMIDNERTHLGHNALSQFREAIQ